MMIKAITKGQPEQGGRDSGTGSWTEPTQGLDVQL